MSDLQNELVRVWVMFYFSGAFFGSLAGVTVALGIRGIYRKLSKGGK